MRWLPWRRPAGARQERAAGEPSTVRAGGTAGTDGTVTPTGTATAAPMTGQPGASATSRSVNAWPVVCERFALDALVLAEQLRPALDRLEDGEEDPDRLQLLYQVDHAITRMRRTARDLRILAGRGEPELAGHTTPVVDVVRMAASSIERYTQVTIGTAPELAIAAYASDDLASLLAALVDNATRYSPSAVTVSAHLLQDGGVMFRIEDNGIGIAPDELAALNDILTGPVPEVDEHTGRHTGFPVVHRLARGYGMWVRLVSRPTGSGSPTRPGDASGAASNGGGTGGTTAMVTVPAQLVCEIPPPTLRSAPAAGHGAGHASAATVNGAVGPTAAAEAASTGQDLLSPAATPPAVRPTPVPVAADPSRPSTPTDPPSSPDTASPRGGPLPRRHPRSIRATAANRPGAAAPGPATSPGASAAQPPATGSAAGRPAPPSPASDPAAARRKFAEDVTAFTQGGSRDRTRENQPPGTDRDGDDAGEGPRSGAHDAVHESAPADTPDVSPTDDPHGDRHDPPDDRRAGQNSDQADQTDQKGQK